MAAMFAHRVAAHAQDHLRVAIVDPEGTWTYADMVHDAFALAAVLLDGADDLAEARVALLCAPGHDFAVALLACWQAGAIAVPLHPSHPDAEIAHVLSDAEVSVIVTSDAHRHHARRLADTHGLTFVPVATTSSIGPLLPDVRPERRALIVYTSGTTGRPKGVVHTHRSLMAMAEGMVEAWRWSPDDRILLVLPLHHVHGIANVVLCALWAGAVCEAPGGFDADATWERLGSSELTLFMAVPTVYRRLIAAWDEADAYHQELWASGAAKARLMVSGSAALPVSTLERWAEITGHVLLERYGMTELGMVLSNSLDHRVPGHVGEPMPGVELRQLDDGELLVRGPQVFSAYWGRPSETAAAFVDDGWFRTGDVAVHDPDGYRLLGRSSVDIIKTGGEKVSALEIEEVLRTHPAVADCAVVGVPDPEWGERVCAAVVSAGSDSDPDLVPDDLRSWGKEQMAVYKVPSRYLVVDDLPRNALGKVVKPKVAELFS
jgi:malonyl-CoA/methylmalonyl-CoA synthetase